MDSHDDPNNSGVHPYDDVNVAEVSADADAKPPRPLSIPSARKLISGTLVQIGEGDKQLARLTEGTIVASSLGDIAADMLVCAALAVQYPPEFDDDILRKERVKARAGGYNKHAGLARDEVEDVLAALEASSSTLRGVSIMGKPLPATWGNLSAVPLARKVNEYGHTLFRGRIPGINL